jgi:hypothetical protein
MAPVWLTRLMSLPSSSTHGSTAVHHPHDFPWSEAAKLLFLCQTLPGPRFVLIVVPSAVFMPLCSII